MGTCAAAVNYRQIIDDARAHIERTYSRPFGQSLQRWIVLNVLTRPWLGRLLIEVGKRVPRPVAAALPGRLRRFVSLAKETIIAKGPIAPAGENRAAMTRGTIVLVEGCIQQVIAPRINDAAARFLERSGFSVRRTRTQCCGALALHMGRPDKAKQTAAKLLQEVEGHLSDDLQGIVITASGCGAVVKEYDKLFTGTAFETLARRVSQKARDMSEIITAIETLSPARDAAFEVALHEPCSLNFGQGLSGQYVDILKRLGLSPNLVPEGHMCCGSAGSYSILEPEISDRLGERRAHNIKSVGAPVVASANIGCIQHLGRFLEKPPLHAIELVDWMTGGPCPPELNGWEAWETTKPPASYQAGGIW
jgi:glycolate oxidase iron-sulfur subunit